MSKQSQSDAVAIQAYSLLRLISYTFRTSYALLFCLCKNLIILLPFCYRYFWFQSCQTLISSLHSFDQCISCFSIYRPIFSSVCSQCCDSPVFMVCAQLPTHQGLFKISIQSVWLHILSFCLMYFCCDVFC